MSKAAYLADLFQPPPKEPESGRRWIYLHKALEDFETDLIKTALVMCNANHSHAAKSLGINRTTLVEKIKKYSVVLGVDRTIYEEIRQWKAYAMSLQNRAEQINRFVDILSHDIDRKIEATAKSGCIKLIQET